MYNIISLESMYNRRLFKRVGWRSSEYIIIHVYAYLPATAVYLDNSFNSIRNCFPSQTFRPTYKFLEDTTLCSSHRHLPNT